MKLKVGDEVKTPFGKGLIRWVAYDRKFDVSCYFVDIPKTILMARISKEKYDTIKFWEYEVKEVTE